MSNLSGVPLGGEKSPYQQAGELKPSAELDLAELLSEELEPRAAGPQADDVEAFGQKHWGNRDLWTWLIGLAAPVQLVLGWWLVQSTQERADPTGELLRTGLLLLGNGGVCALFWMGFRVARVGVLMAFPLQMLLNPLADLLVIPLLDYPVTIFGFWWGWAWTLRLALALVVHLCTWGIVCSARNRLFFRIDVPREELTQAWREAGSPRAATAPRGLAAAGY